MPEVFIEIKSWEELPVEEIKKLLRKGYRIKIGRTTESFSFGEIERYFLNKGLDFQVAKDEKRKEVFEIVLPDKIEVKIEGSAYGQDFNFECELLEKSDKEARFRTLSDPPHQIKVSPRHGHLNEIIPGIKQKLDFLRIKDDKIKAFALVNILLDEKYGAVGEFIETDEGIEIIAHEW